jgi:Xaa-Pro dipeptidase
MVPGARAADVHTILARGAIERSLRDSYDNITGYTLGYYSQQPLRSSDFTRVFDATAPWLLEPGMVFHMYTSAKGLAFSETVHVTASGPERLTRIERKLFSAR